MNETSIDPTGIDRINQINELVFRLAKDDDMTDLSPSQDPGFLREFYLSKFYRIPQVATDQWVFLYISIKLYNSTHFHI